MDTGHRIESAVDGFHCSRCGTAYPSLYWFKRDPATEETFCLRCAEAGPSEHLEDVLPVPDPEARKPTDWRELAAWYAGAIVLTVYGVLEDDILQRLGVDSPTMLGVARIIFGVAVAMVSAGLARFAFDRAVTRWSWFRRLVTRDSEAASG